MDIQNKIDEFLRFCTAIGEEKSWWLQESEVESELRRLYEGIKTLRSENEALSRYKTAYEEWSDKTQWVQDTSSAKELGMHRADVLKQRIDWLSAENEALREIVEAVAHIGVDFGYGAFDLGNEHIEKARALIESQATKGE